MSARKLKVLLTRRLPDAVETRMRELFDAELNLKDQPMDRAALAAAVQRAEVLVPTITDVIDADLINGAGEQLKMIANFGAGVDHIDVDAAVAAIGHRPPPMARIDTLHGDEPWPGYDELTAAEVQAVLSEGDDERAQQVRTYERAHKNRAGVLHAAERELANA